MFFSERGVPPLPANALDLILVFDLLGQGKEFFHLVVQLVDQLIGQKMSAQGHKTNVFKSTADLFGKLLFPLRIARHEIL